MLNILSVKLFNQFYFLSATKRPESLKLLSCSSTQTLNIHAQISDVFAFATKHCPDTCPDSWLPC